jgi:diguanylate cyclase (GGDEF)-like protein
MNLMEIDTFWGESLAGAPVFAPDDCWALRRGKIHVAVAESQGPHCRHLSAVPTHNYLCLPLLAGGELFGLVHVQALKDLNPEAIESLRQLGVTVADHISLALANLSLRDRLRYQALHDTLTGLFNRRYLEETLERELRRVQRRAVPLGVIMLDLDHFKRFNDTYGHAGGDDLLRVLGKYLQTQVRQEDIACRYGGEEFVLILPEAPREAVLQRAEEIRQMVPRLQVFQEGKLLESTTVSLGVAMFPEHGATGQEVIQAADDAMYQAKAAGRNRVVAAAERCKASSNPS